MPMQPTLFSFSGAATEIGVDRRTLASALSGISPDGKIGKHPAWRLRTILKAIERGQPGSGRLWNADVDEMERLIKALLAGLEQLEAESDIATTRKMFEVIGANFGELDALGTRMNETFPDAEREFCEQYRSMTMSRLLQEFLHLVQWKFRPEDLEESE